MKTLTKVMLVFSILLIFLPSQIISQAPDTAWTKSYGGLERESSLSMQITDAGDFIIAGTIELPVADITILKTNASGELLWQKTYNSNTNDAASHLAITEDGGFIITGRREYEGLLLWKTNSNGDTIWTNPKQGSSLTIGHCVVQHNDGGYLVAGGFVVNDGHCLVVKFSDIGIMQWAKGYGQWSGSFKYIIKTSDSNYVAVGNMGADPRHIYLIKINSLGNLIWERSYENNITNTIGNCVQETSDGGLIITGYKDFNIPNKSTWLIKTDSDGDTLWTRILYGDGGNSVRQTNDEGFIIQSNLSGNGVLNKTDKNGNLLWTKTFSGNDEDYFTSVNQCSDLGYIVGGYSNSFGFGDYDIWLVKTLPDISDVNTEDQMLNSYKLFENYPNPFNPSTKIKYQIPKQSFITLKIFDVLGNEIKFLVNEEKTAGTYEIEFDASALSSGVYFYQLRTNEFSETKKMLLLK